MPNIQYANPLVASVSGSGTKILNDTKAKVPTKPAYYLAYVSDYGALLKVGKPMTLQNALLALGCTGAANTLQQRFTYDRGRSSEAQRTLEHLGSGDWGIYVHDQADAKALATIVGATAAPEVHGSTHSFHIWYGGILDY